MFERTLKKIMDALWIVGYVVLGVVAFFYIILYYRCLVVRIDPSECSSSTGPYGVLPGMAGEVLRNCGPAANQECTFEAASLSDAALQCEKLQNNCDAFTFNEKTGSVSFLDAGKGFSSAPFSNVYQRRVRTFFVRNSL